MDKVILKDKRISRKKVGIGIIITMRMPTTPIAIIAELDLALSINGLFPTASKLAIFLYPNILTFFWSYT